MRVITGSARGRRLRTLEGEDVRPTTERVKEGVFSAIQFDIEGRRFLDLFAGSGQMGIEALSRGASLAVFTDASADAVEVVRENLRTTGLAQKARVLQSDAFAFLAHTTDLFDIAFLDPPYASGLLLSALEAAERVMSNYGLLLAEHPAHQILPQQVGTFLLSKEYRYGQIHVTAYRKGS